MNTLSAPAWSFKGKISEKRAEVTPGPSDYEPNKLSLKNPTAVKIGTSKKSYVARTSTPGPGSYEHQSSDSLKKGIKIGNSKRKFAYGENKTPGPGSYNLRIEENEAPKYSMSGRNIKILIKNNPGPGHYENDLNDFTSKTRAPTFIIGNDKRITRPSSAVPGPGAYNLDTQDLGPKWKFNSQSKESLAQFANPGVGTYNILSAAMHQGCSMTSRRSPTPQDPTPGPGSYNPTMIRKRSPSWKMGTSSRSEFKKSKNTSPGPAEYSPLLQSHKSVATFNRASRDSFLSSNKNPGPGEYNKESSLTGPSYTMRPKTAEKVKESSPGPGDYNLLTINSKFAWTIGKEKRKTDKNLSNKIPGPGQYNTEIEEKGPKWVFGTAPKVTKSSEEGAPGPGSYNFTSSFANLPNYVKIKRTSDYTNK